MKHRKEERKKQERDKEREREKGGDPKKANKNKGKHRIQNNRNAFFSGTTFLLNKGRKAKKKQNKIKKKQK